MRRSAVRAAAGVVAAGTVAGVAAWLTGASLDVFVDPVGGPTRVAMLPSPARLLWLVVACVGLAGLLVLGVAWARSQPGERDEGQRDAVARAAPVLLPVGALGLLTLPYLTWLPDGLPLLQVLAGPARLVVWFVVLGQLAWLAAPPLWRAVARRRPGSWVVPGAARPWTTVVFLVGLTVFGSTGLSRLGSATSPGGDEPHYLIIAQSLWLDDDLAIENNHAREDYAEYFASPLRPHYLTRGVDNEIYSVHPIGLPIVMAPVYGVGGYPAVILLLAAMGAAAGTLMWGWTSKTCGSLGASSFAWAAVCLSAPYLGNASMVYPEIAAALCVMLAFVPHEPEAGPARWIRTTVVPVVAIGALPWLSTKYAPMAGVLALVAAARLWHARAHPTGRDTRARRLAITLGIPAISVVGWLLFFHAFWGSPLPSVPYGGDTQTRLSHVLVGAPGLLLDQEYGVLPYAPVLVLGLTRLVTMARGGGRPRRLAVEIALVTTALLLTVGAFRIWWGGSAAPGRPVTSALLLLGLPIAWQYAAARSATRRAWYRLLLLVGLSVTVLIVTMAGGLLAVNLRDGPSTLLEWLSPNWHLWALFPSFIHDDPATALALAGVWLVVSGVTVRFVTRVVAGTADGGDIRPAQDLRGLGRCTLAATSAGVIIVLTVSALIPWLLGDRLQPDVVLEARPRLRLLDEFDATARPVAVVYDPLRRVQASEIPGRFSFIASPEIARVPPPVPLLHDARFALPAGTYLVELTWQHPAPPVGDAIPSDATLAWQLTREGSPSREWRVPLDGTTSWRRAVTLPIDVDFSGFHASPELEARSPILRLSPIDIRDLHARPASTSLIATARYRGVDVFVHDASTWLEPTGFWVRGGATAAVTLFGPARTGTALRYHCGPQPNAVRLTTADWQEEQAVRPGAGREAIVPPTADGIVALRISTREGFVPSAVDATSDDVRFLGCWFEIGDGE